MILGRPWLYDNDIHIFGRSNVVMFEHDGKKIKIHPIQPKTSDPQPSLNKQPKGLNLIGAK